VLHAEHPRTDDNVRQNLVLRFDDNAGHLAYATVSRFNVCTNMDVHRERPSRYSPANVVSG